MDKKVLYVVLDLTEFKSLPALLLDVIWKYSELGDAFDLMELPDFARRRIKANRTVRCYAAAVDPKRIGQLKKDLKSVSKSVPKLNLLVLNPRKA